MPAARRSQRFRAIPYYRDQLGGISRLGVLALFSAQFQAAALVLVVPLATATANGESEFHGELGPITLTASTGTVALLAAGAILAAATLDISISWFRSRMMARWELSRREQVIAEFLRADYATQAGERLGTLGTLTGYVNRGSAALGAVVNAVTAALTVTIFIAGAIFLDPPAALFLIAMIVVLSLALRPVMVRTKRYSKELSATLVDYGRSVTESTHMARDVRVFHASGPVGERMTRISRRLAHVRQRASFVNGVTSPIYQYLGMLLVVGALAAARGWRTIDVAAFGGIALLLLRSLSFGQQLQNAYQNYIEAIPFVEKLEDVRAMYRANATRDGTIVLEAVHNVELDEVRFSYGGGVEALAGVSASFTVGEIVGIVGPSGSGKSTLSQLILRLREPTGGGIRVNRTPASDYTLASWYRHVSLVPQDPRLLHTTVAENIAFLDRSITRRQVIEAARAAGVHEVIEDLEHGYETMIGPAFRDLSGGQIQRIGIARALARGAQVLVLDEPTSALDVHSEGVIQASLEALRGRVLVLIIAHRLSTLSICDRVLVLREGHVETIGSLADVSERSDFFRRALDAGTLEIGAGERPAIGLPDEA
jgi:ABC-type multidrug transport system fused ATPase/permease subunit